MPLYQFRCKECMKFTEEIVSFEESKTIKCSECGAPLERQMSRPGTIKFKGKGFYATDYKNSETES